MSSSEPWTNLDVADLVEHMSEGLQVIGADLRYRYINRVAAEHGRKPREELLGRTMMEAYPGIDETELFTHLRRILADGGTHSMENEFTYPDGSKGWFELRMARLPQGVMILSLDVTARKRLEAQVLRSQRMDAIGQLAGGVAHDFNNLLTVIQAYGSFIRDDLPDGHPMRADAECVLDAARRGAGLTQKLLTFARPLPVSAQTVSVGHAIPEIGKMLRRTIGDQVVLAIDADAEVGEVRMDPTAFDQVLVNLVVNARDALEGSGTVTIETTRTEIEEAWSVSRGVTLAPGEYVVVSVSDTGVGIPPDELDRVFEPFVTTKAETGGTGLGLATCWGLVAQAGGTISVYSEVGAGTTFRIYLPRTIAHVERPERPEPRSLDGRGEHVLVVEDQPQVRELISRILRGRDYRVLEATSAAEAMLVVEDIGDRVDLVVTDMVMPRMSGLELVDRLRRRLPSIRVLLVSGFAPRSLALRGLDPGELPILAKPFTPEALLRAIRSALDHSR